MKRILSIMITGILAIVAFPSGAAVTVTDNYDLAGLAGTNLVNPGYANEFCGYFWSGEELDTVCTPVRMVDEDGFEVGVVGLRSPAGPVHTNVVLSVEDDNFDSTFGWTCIYEADQGNICTGDFTSEGCGSLSLDTGGALLFGGAWPSENSVSLFLNTAYVDTDTLEICLGSQGVVTGTFS